MPLEKQVAREPFLKYRENGSYFFAYEGRKMTPFHREYVPIEPSVFNREREMETFARESAEIEASIREYVLDAMRRYNVQRPLEPETLLSEEDDDRTNNLVKIATGQGSFRIVCPYCSAKLVLPRSGKYRCNNCRHRLRIGKFGDVLGG